MNFRPPAAAARLPAQALGALLATALLTATACRPNAPADPPLREIDPDTIPDAFARPSGTLAWPGAHRAFLVTPAGDLTNGAWVVHLRLETAGRAAAAPTAIAAEDRWLPVLHWTRRAGLVRWRCRAVVAPPAAADSSIVVSLEATVVNTTRETLACGATLELLPLGAHPAFVASDADSIETAGLRLGHGGSMQRVHGWCGAARTGNVATSARTLAPGERLTLRALLPAYATPERRLAAVARVSQATLEQHARDYWTTATARGMTLDLGDPEVERAFRAARVVLLECRERDGDGWRPIGNPFQYRDVWVRDGARLATALAMAGHTREARDVAAGLLAFQWPHGPFMSQRGQLDGTGQALWAFEQTQLRPAPSADLPRFTAAAARALDWVVRQRAAGAGAAAAEARLLPFGNPGDDEVTRAQLVGNDAWTLAGCRAAARMWRAAGRLAEARAADSLREAYTADVRRALAGRADVPAAWQPRGRDWGNVAVAYPCAIVAPDDPRIAALARRLWRYSGCVGLAAYGAPDSVQAYLAADLGTAALLAGDRATADSVLSGLLAWRDGQGGGAELFSRSHRDFGDDLPPHASAAAALVMLVRNTVVFDDGDTLALTLGPRAAWWRHGRVRGAPTRWGTIDVTFRSDGAAAAWGWTPVPVWTRLVLPAGTRVHGALPPGCHGATDGRSLLAQPGMDAVVVALAPGRP